ncbi:hypothetical protein G4B88_024564 [Cannabis sativa]|uniref:Uncharacterized protein n=1 Tax=Cannabis sativa TaxID=3483 RepID=A0A7J6GVP3_CANSA|nr:hypothetical protein G4B88_024564 [Cannabis sativa]
MKQFPSTSVPLLFTYLLQETQRNPVFYASGFSAKSKGNCWPSNSIACRKAISTYRANQGAGEVTTGGFRCGFITSFTHSQSHNMYVHLSEARFAKNCQQNFGASCFAVSSSEICNVLKDENIQKLICDIDNSSDPEKELDKAMESEMFCAFADKILSTVNQ